MRLGTGIPNGMLGRRLGVGTLAALLVAAPFPIADAQEPAAIDAAIDKLMALDPAAIVARLDALRNESEAQAAEAAALLEQATQLETEATELEARLTGIETTARALGMRFGLGEGAPVVADAGGDMEMADAQAFVNFADHVKPIFDQRCARCHNVDQRKSGLSVATFAALMEGGSSGPVIEAGNPDGSRLFRLLARMEEPYMPPSGDPLSDEQVATVRQWIVDGALADATSQPMAKNEPEGTVGEDGIYIAAVFADTPPMPAAGLPEANPLPTRGVVARAVDASPTAPLIAVAGDHQVVLYHFDTLDPLGALDFPEGDIFTLTFSVNGELLLAGGGEEGVNGAAALWNVRSGERIGTYGQYYDTVLAADISPDHRFVTLGGTNQKARVYARDTGQELFTLGDHTDWILAVKYTPDGEVLATADRAGGLNVWQAATGRFVESLRGHEGPIHALAYTRDSKLLASAGEDGTVRLWDTWEYKQARQFNAHSMPVLNVDISDDGRIATASADSLARVFDLKGQKLLDLPSLDDWVYQARFGHAGDTVLAGSWAGEVRIYTADSAEVRGHITTNGESAKVEPEAAPVEG